MACRVLKEVNVNPNCAANRKNVVAYERHPKIAIAELNLDVGISRMKFIRQNLNQLSVKPTLLLHTIYLPCEHKYMTIKIKIRKMLKYKNKVAIQLYSRE